MKSRARTPGHDQPDIRLTRERNKSTLNLANVPRVDWTQFHSERWRDTLHGRELPDANNNGFANDSRTHHAGRNLFEQFQPFRAGTIFGRRKACCVATRACEAFNETSSDWIGDSD